MCNPFQCVPQKCFPLHRSFPPLALTREQHRFIHWPIMKSSKSRCAGWAFPWNKLLEIHECCAHCERTHMKISVIFYAVWIRFTKKQKQHAGATRRHRSPAACHASDRLFVCLLIATFVSRLCSCPGCCFSGGSPGKLSSVTLICPDWTEVTIVGQACSSSGFLPHINKHREGHTCPLFLHFCWIYRFILATWLCPLFFI